MYPACVSLHYHGHCSQVIAVLLPLLSKGSWQAQQSALLATKGVASQSGPALRPWVPALLPALLQAACHSRPEVHAFLLASRASAPQHAHSHHVLCESPWPRRFNPRDIGAMLSDVL